MILQPHCDVMKFDIAKNYVLIKTTGYVDFIYNLNYKLDSSL